MGRLKQKFALADLVLTENYQDIFERNRDLLPEDFESWSQKHKDDAKNLLLT